jgi:hypothetical protein
VRLTDLNTGATRVAFQHAARAKKLVVEAGSPAVALSCSEDGTSARGLCRGFGGLRLVGQAGAGLMRMQQAKSCLTLFSFLPPPALPLPSPVCQLDLRERPRAVRLLAAQPDGGEVNSIAAPRWEVGAGEEGVGRKGPAGPFGHAGDNAVVASGSH